MPPSRFYFPRWSRALIGGVVMGWAAVAAKGQLAFSPSYAIGVTPQQQAATTAALNTLAGYFANNLTITVNVSTEDMVYTPPAWQAAGSGAILGTSSSNSIGMIAPPNGYYYPGSLARVLNPSYSSPTAISIRLNSLNSINWSYDAGAPGLGNYSWQSVVMHEVLHAMGFTTGVTSSGYVLYGNYTIFDTFVEDHNHNSLAAIALGGGSDTLRSNLLADNKGVFWNGAYAVAANGGEPVRLSGFMGVMFYEDYSHVGSDSTGSLMSAMLDTNMAFLPSEVELAMMRDMGWTLTAVPEPTTWAGLAGAASLAWAVWHRRRRVAH